MTQPKRMDELKWEPGDRVVAALPDGTNELIDPSDLANVHRLAALRGSGAKFYKIPRSMMELPPLAPMPHFEPPPPIASGSIEWTTRNYSMTTIVPMPRTCYVDMSQLDTPEELEARLAAIEERIASENRARLEAVDLVVSIVRCVLAGFAHDQWRAEMAREAVETLVEIMLVCGRLTGSPIELDIDSKPEAPSDGGAMGVVFELFPIEID